ncbi:GDSL-type esterase/lipase family protein [Kitasatospora sp. NPDC057940]|uniref:GDSL-type esterase/lipase family protein n=1 Tax=Kitasatospora sp. NPDC057940 TaxID=3346285 RepID=UPI0036DD75D9
MDLTPDRSDRALRGSALFGSPSGGRPRRRFAVCGAVLALAVASLQELPDVVLVELGFNDIGWLGAGPGLVPTMKQFIDNVRAVNPNARIVEGNVPQRTTLGSANPQLPQRTTDYDNALAAALPTHSARVEGLTPGHHYVAFVCTWNAAGEGKPRIPDAVVVR